MLIDSENENTYDVIDIFKINTIESLPITAAILAKEYGKDSAMQNLMQKLRNGVQLKPKERFNINQNEFCICNDVLIRGHRVIIPKMLQKHILTELHTGHFEMVKTKTLARGYCWWPNIDKDIEEVISNCPNCNLIKNDPAIIETHS